MSECDSSGRAALSRLRYWLAGVLGQLVVLAVGRSMRLVAWTGKRFGSLRGKGEKAIIAFWHNKLFYMSYCITAHYVRKGGRVAVLISSSRDGEYMTRVAQRLGAKVVRGSSTRLGGAGFRSLTRWAEKGVSLCVAPDGPKGPRYEVKEGTIYLAQRTGLPILPVSYCTKGSVEFNSWDGFVLPLPFSSVEVRCGELLRVPSDLKPGERRTYCAELRDRLMELEKIWR